MHRFRFICCVIAVAACESPSEPVERPANTALGLRVWATVSPTVLRLADSTAVLHIRLDLRDESAGIKTYQNQLTRRLTRSEACFST